MKRGKRGLKRKAPQHGPDEKPDDKLETRGFTFRRIYRLWQEIRKRLEQEIRKRRDQELWKCLEQEMLKRFEQDRLQRRGLFRFELAIITGSLIFCAIIVVGDYPWALQLGAAATMWYIFREIIKDITNKF